MSKGTPTRTVRISDAEWREFETAVSHRNEHVHLPPLTMREFIVVACREKIAKWDRSRGRKLSAEADTVDLAEVAHWMETEPTLLDPIENDGANS